MASGDVWLAKKYVKHWQYYNIQYLLEAIFSSPDRPGPVSGLPVSRLRPGPQHMTLYSALIAPPPGTRDMVMGEYIKMS